MERIWHFLAERSADLADRVATEAVNCYCRAYNIGSHMPCGMTTS
jgi:hypothetical protein